MPPIEQLIDDISIGNIYWFVNPQINSFEPHPHVCIGINDNDCVFMICGTSQFESRKRYFELNELPFETLVMIKPNETNSITKQTFIDCNEVQVHDIGDLYYNRTLKLRGKITESELLQVKQGIEISELLEQSFKRELLKFFPEF